jgi:hypothetical protein
MPTITLQYTDAEHGKTLHCFMWATPLLVARAQEGLTKMESIKHSSITSTQWPRNSVVDLGAGK